MNEDERIRRMLTVYCEWLNMWQKNDGDDFRYELCHFLQGDGQTELVGTITKGYYHILHIVTTDGDSGGPHDLTGFFDPDDNTLVHLIQTFDTYTQSIYDTTSNGPEVFLSTPKF